MCKNFGCKHIDQFISELIKEERERERDDSMVEIKIMRTMAWNTLVCQRGSEKLKAMRAIIEVDWGNLGNRPWNRMSVRPWEARMIHKGSQSFWQWAYVMFHLAYEREWTLIASRRVIAPRRRMRASCLSKCEELV